MNEGGRERGTETERQPDTRIIKVTPSGPDRNQVS